MKALYAIAVQTVRSSLRSRVFHVLFVLVMLAVLVLPVTVTGDGTALGQVQIAITYSLGVVTVLISVATLWLGCAQLPREIEAYQMHLVLTKPAPRWLVYAGKWLGIFLMHAFLFLVAAAIVYALVMLRLKRGDFTEREMDRLRHEVLVGRRLFRSEQPPFRKLARQNYQARLKAGELKEGHNRAQVLQEIERQIRASSTEIPPGMVRSWTFENIDVADTEDARVYCRYRVYVGSTTKTGQRSTVGLWGIRDPAREEERYQPLLQRVPGGSFHEFAFPARFVSENGTVKLTYQNRDPENESVIFQIADGPLLLVKAAGFLNNYVRSVFMVVLQLAFLAALGCTAGAALSSPVAIFAGMSYLVIGMTVQAAVAAPLEDPVTGRVKYESVLQQGAHIVAQVTSYAVVSVEEFNTAGALARGRLIEMRRLAAGVFKLLLFRGLPVAALGMWILTRRELGTVIRR